MVSPVAYHRLRRGVIVEIYAALGGHDAVPDESPGPAVGSTGVGRRPRLIETGGGPP